jgi:hypothetical protein
MPSVSKKQAKFMAAAAHNLKFAKKVHMSQKVAKDFNKADAKTGILKDSASKDKEFTITYEYHENIHYYKAKASSAAQAKEKFFAMLDRNDRHDVKVLDAKLDEAELDNHSRWVLDGGMNTVQEGEPEFQGAPATGASTLGPKSVKILDKAIMYVSKYDTASDRQAALQRFADHYKVKYQDLYDLITADTGGDYFVKDAVPESSGSFKEFLNKIK